jgi:hypothetical protein
MQVLFYKTLVNTRIKKDRIKVGKIVLGKLGNLDVKLLIETYSVLLIDPNNLLLKSKINSNKPQSKNTIKC